MTLPVVVRIEHHAYTPDLPHMITVRRQNGEVLFERTLNEVAEWLKDCGFEWAGVSGIWAKQPKERK